MEQGRKEGASGSENREAKEPQLNSRPQCRHSSTQNCQNTCCVHPHVKERAMGLKVLLNSDSDIKLYLLLVAQEKK